MAEFEMPDDVAAAILDDGIDPETGELLEPRDDSGDEPEPDESDPENQPEPEPKPEALTEAKAEAIFSSLDRYKATVTREVEKRADVLFADLEPCPLCMGGGPAPGFFFPHLPEPEGSMRLFAVTQVLGGSGEPQYPDDPDTEMCDRCGGYGKTRTGSKAQGQETRACPGCNGQGWKNKPPVTPTWEPSPLSAPALMPQPFANGAAANPDAWGRPVGHPHYGQIPALIGA